MGAYSPVPFVPDDLVDDVMEQAIWPTLREMQRRGAEYRGLLYCGLMLTAGRAQGHRVQRPVRRPRVPGDRAPPRVGSLRPLLRVRRRQARDAGGDARRRVRRRSYLAAEGYPPDPTRTGDVIEGLDAAAALPGVLLFHAGHARRGSGGRHQRRPGGHGVRARARPSPPRATARTRPQPASPGPASTTVATSPPKRSMTRRPVDPHMIPRYSLPEIADLFTDEARFAAWLEVEVLAVEAWAELGVVPAEHARIVRERAGFDVAGRSTSARRSPTTTSPRSSTSCRRPSARPRAAGSTTGSRRATSSTPRSRCR